jgi:hypothetical protein
MKNIRFIVAICAALMIAAPAMALEVEVSGHYFVEGYNHSNEELKDTDATNDYLSMEFMAKPVFKVNDNITITTQFTALQDHVWGDNADSKAVNESLPISDSNGNFITTGERDDNGFLVTGAPEVDSSNNIDWKAAYMTIKTPIGGFIVGRYIDTPWGLGLGDSTASHGSNSLHKDRIMWVIPVGDFISGAVYQKNVENDNNNLVSDEDFTKAYVFSAYKQENWSSGLLFAKYTHKDYPSSKNLQTAVRNAAIAKQTEALTTAGALALGADLATALAAGANAAAPVAAASTAAYETRGSLELWVIDPYFKGNFGGLGIEAELLYGWGDVDQNGLGTDDLDAKGLGYMFDLSYDFGTISLMAGTTFIQGDWDLEDDTASPMGYFEPSIDHERGFLLTSDTSGLETTLGGRVNDPTVNGTGPLGMPMGNLSGGPGTVTAQAGAQMFYVDIAWQVLENLELGLFAVTSNADDVPKTVTGVKWDDDHGQEFDFKVKWDIMDNLTFNGVVAHLSVGDYWKQGDPDREVEDLTTIYGQLIVEF